MAYWIRVFGTKPYCPSATDLFMTAVRHGFEIESAVLGEDDDWEQVTLKVPGAEEGVMVENVARGPEGEAEVKEEIRPVVATFEGRSGEKVEEVLRTIRSTRQLFIIGVPRAPQQSPLYRLARVLAEFLASETDGIYQIPDRGFYSADGQLLVPDAP